MVEPGDIYDDPNILNPIIRFGALTKLQYDRFKKWKDGEFRTVEPQHLAKIEDVDVSDQPNYLTRAILEQTIGDPLFPGIEMWWLAKLPETVGLRYTLFRVINNSALFHSTILVSDLIPLSESTMIRFSLGISLEGSVYPGRPISTCATRIGRPDLHIVCLEPLSCFARRWPATRPDVVVTKADFEEAMHGSGTGEQKFATATTTRRNWTRGLRDTTSESSLMLTLCVLVLISVDYISFPGSTDMVRFWTYLGFVKQYPDLRPPVYLESERLALPKPN